MDGTDHQVLKGGPALESVVRRILEIAADEGADQAQAAASQDTGTSVTARLGDVENLEYTNDRGVGLTVYVDTKKGNASTSDFSDEALRETVRKALTFAQQLTHNNQSPTHAHTGHTKVPTSPLGRSQVKLSSHSMGSETKSG